MKKIILTSLALTLSFIFNAYSQECKPVTLKADAFIYFNLTKLEFNEAGNLDNDDIVDYFYDEFSISFQVDCMIDNGDIFWTGDWSQEYSFAGYNFTLGSFLLGTNGETWSVGIDVNLYHGKDIANNNQYNIATMDDISDFNQLPTLMINSFTNLPQELLLSYGFSIKNIRVDTL